jgi:short subunit dehydrogenase-like uncharacterized protein
VVVNTIGPFSRTAPPIARTCLAGSHYVDVANDVTAVTALLGLNDEATAASRAIVTGAGFGVLATEAVVAMLCRDRPTPTAVQVDALASVETAAGEIGSALAATLVEGVALGGRRYADGRLVRARLGAAPQRLTPPDGGTATSTSNLPTGELVAAYLASGAPPVTAGFGSAPTAPLVRAVLPLASTLLTVPPLRALAVRRLGGTHVGVRPRPTEHSWGRAVVHWPDDIEREGWLRTGDAMDFTAAVLAEVTLRRARGDGTPGAYTPAAAFGPDLATGAGGMFFAHPVNT